MNKLFEAIFGISTIVVFGVGSVKAYLSTNEWSSADYMLMATTLGLFTGFISKLNNGQNSKETSAVS